jgi:Predicted membrane protein
MAKNMKYSVKQFMVFLSGIVLMTLGVSLTVKSEVGAGAYDSINFGLANLLKINVSIAIWITSFVVAVISSMVRKRFLKFTTFLTSILVGISTDMWVMMTESIVFSTTYEKVVIYLIGIFLIATGIAIYIIPNLPVNPTDDLMVALTEEKSISLMKAKLSIDGICIIIAFILKGPIGIGTITATLFVGPLIDIINKIIIRICSKSLSIK